MLAINALQSEQEDAMEKLLDPYEDSALMQFLTYGRHLEGSSKKRIKRIQKLAEHYKLAKDILWYRCDVSSPSFNLQVPPKELRNHIVAKAHLFGHFGKTSTFNYLKDKYYWPKMIDDVKQITNKCEVCLRNNHSKIMQHPAIAIPVNEIFQRIGIDLVLGLPETEDGFKGILVVTEYLTKFPYAVPIKSKTSEEIASHLMVYISIFGPPKEILS